MLARVVGCLGAFILVAWVQGCANGARAGSGESPPTTLPSQADLVGTWRIASVQQGGVVRPLNGWKFFMRFYVDGTCASWPVPTEEIYKPGAFNTDANRVSRGKYAVEDGELTLPDASGVKAEVRATGERMWYWNTEGVVCEYDRVRPDLEPGVVP